MHTLCVCIYKVNAQYARSFLFICVAHSATQTSSHSPCRCIAHNIRMCGMCRGRGREIERDRRHNTTHNRRTPCNVDSPAAWPRCVRPHPYSFQSYYLFVSPLPGQSVRSSIQDSFRCPDVT